MDTYIHIIVGAAAGSLSANLMDRVAFQRQVMTGREATGKRPPLVASVSVFSTGIVAGLLSHLLTDALPHGDLLVKHGQFIPNRLWPLREFLASLCAVALITATTRGSSRFIALAAGLFGGLPDVESLLIGIGWLQKQQAVFPVHNGTYPHGKNLGAISVGIEIGSLLLSVIYFLTHALRRAHQKRI